MTMRSGEKAIFQGSLKIFLSFCGMVNALQNLPETVWAVAMGTIYGSILHGITADPGRAEFDLFADATLLEKFRI